MMTVPIHRHRNDAQIEARGRQALEHGMLTPCDPPLRMNVVRGVVTLAGSVAYWSQRYDAERAVERVEGVRKVINQIVVRDRRLGRVTPAPPE
jgi:osmotically-inducible protein OsmY